MDLNAEHVANAVAAIDRAQTALLEAYVQHGFVVSDVRDQLSAARVPLALVLYRMKVEVTNG